MLADSFNVDTKNIEQKENEIISTYTYDTSKIVTGPNGISIVPYSKKIQFKTNTKIPKLGVMIVGWGGNNGTTVTNGILANRLSLKWETKRGEIKANYHGSLTQCSTTYLGQDEKGTTYVAPFKSLLPMVNPNNIEISGWDISKMNIYEATRRAKVLEPTMYTQLKEYTEKMVPLPAVFDLSFVAPNQETRADNIIEGNKEKQLETVRQNIRDFKEKNKLDKIIILWNGNTERFCEVDPKIHGTADTLLEGIKNNEKEISPSTLYCIAAILEHCPYINGSPQNTFVPGVIDLAEREGVILMGDDMKTGQTKLKSVLADFLISSGLKLTAVASYNHLGNNDGLNLDYYKCFRSKEITKASVIDDIVSTGAGALFGMMILQMFQIPILIKFGYEKGKFIQMIAIVLIMMVASILLVTPIKITSLSLNEVLDMLKQYGLYIIAIVTVLFYLLSYKISYNLYKKKEL